MGKFNFNARAHYLALRKVLLPKQFVELAKATHSGAVAVINFYSRRCDALVLLDGGDEVVHLPLPLTHHKAINLSRSWQHTMHHNRMTERGTRIGRLEETCEDMLAAL